MQDSKFCTLVFFSTNFPDYFAIFCTFLLVLAIVKMPPGFKRKSRAPKCCLFSVVGKETRKSPPPPFYSGILRYPVNSVLHWCLTACFLVTT